MKRKDILYFIILCLLWACEKDKVDMQPSENRNIGISKSSYTSDLDDTNMVKGVIKIKLNSSIGDNISIIPQGNIVQSNITPLNTLLSNIRATEMKRLFPYAGKFEERTRREGLHLWYVVNFDPEVSVKSAVAAAKQVKDIQIVEQQYKIIQPEYRLKQIAGSAAAEDIALMNDPLLAYQWHYNNNGEIGGSVKGADINLFKAWDKKVFGKRSVIVDVVDGAIDYNHEDLKDNMYINEAEQKGEAGKDDDGNGYIDDVYGYNFVNDEGSLIPQEHGTHVAGTVAARNNNGIGVCGVAGGDGTADSGVRLMSSQIFVAGKGGNAEAAIKYGADNGAVISQNSWGFPYPGPGAIQASLKAAIDYFIKYAGCDNDANQLPDSPMKGGVVIFAAGNDDKEFTAVPAYYEPVIAVTAMAPDLKKTSYSTYGTWTDIMAPGGDGETFDGGGVYSTIPDDRYAYIDGTSMACPHVSGVAALIASKFGGQGFTNEDLKKRLLTGLRPFNIDANNPEYMGKLGVGYIDAYAVLAEEKDNKAPETPKFIKVTPDFTALNVEWETVADANDVTPVAYTLYYSTRSLDATNFKNAEHVKINGFGYKVGIPISYSLKKLPLNTKFYFAIEAVDRWGAISGASFIEGKTKENHAPIITRENNTPIRLKDDETATLKLKINDPDEGQKWFYSITGYTEGVRFERENDGLLLKFRIVGPLGEYVLKIIAKDIFGAVSEIEIPFEYYKDEPPVLSKEFEKIYTPINKEYAIDLNKYFTDPEGLKMTFKIKSASSNIDAAIKDNTLLITPKKFGEGEIEIIAVDAGGKTVSASIDLQVVNDDIVYLVYPIPVKKILNVRLNKDVDNAKLTIRTVTGISVFEKDVNVKDNIRLVSLDLSGLSGGTYVLYAEANGKTFEQSFIKY